MPESTDSPQVNLLPKPGKRRWNWRWLWLPVVLALLLLGWHAWRLPRYRLIDTFNTNDVLLIPAQTGFLTRESGTTFVLRDWQDGHRRWAVTVRQPQITKPVMRGNPGFGSGYSLSQDGHIFAAATIQANTLHIETWRDGTAAGHLTVPQPQAPPVLFVRVLNSGRVFCWYSYAIHRALPRRTTPVIAVENGRVIARGMFPPETLMAPDGSAVATSTTAGFTYAELQIANGAVYGRKGRIRPPVRWQHQGIAPGGRYTLEYAGNQIRSYSPVSGKAWSVTVPNINRGGDATADGRHVLAYLETRLPVIFEQFKDIPAARRLIGANSSDYLLLYDDAGRRRAVLRPKLRAWWPDGNIDTRWWFPSPDGRTVVMTAVNGVEGRCFFLRY